MKRYHIGIIIMLKINDVYFKLRHVMIGFFIVYEAIPMKETILELLVHIIHELV